MWLENSESNKDVTTREEKTKKIEPSELFEKSISDKTKKYTSVLHVL